MKPNIFSLIAKLESAGLFIGDRDPKVNPGFPGRYMVNDPQDAEGFAIVGDDMEAMVREAHEQLLQNTGEQQSPEKKNQTMKPTIDTLIERYIEAADALESAQRSMQPIVDATNSFVAARDALREHPAFSGLLPKTYFSGSDLDPLGVDGHGSDG